jgi:hypothetical protein
MRPWIGNHWGDPANIFGGVKLLVLGVSAHATEFPVGGSAER